VQDSDTRLLSAELASGTRCSGPGRLWGRMATPVDEGAVVELVLEARPGAGPPAGVAAEPPVDGSDELLLLSRHPGDVDSPVMEHVCKQRRRQDSQKVLPAKALQWNLGYTSKSRLKRLDVELRGTYK